MQGKVIVITRATSGIGQVAAERLDDAAAKRLWLESARLGGLESQSS